MKEATHITRRLVLTMALAAGAATPALFAPHAEAAIYQEAGGVISIESENANPSTIVSGYAWYVETSAPTAEYRTGASGNAHLHLGPQSPSDNAVWGAAGDGPAYSYQFKTSGTGAGTYNIYIRARGDIEGLSAGSADSFWYDITDTNGTVVGTTQSALTAATQDNEWVWDNALGSVGLAANETYTLTFYGRENGPMHDKLVLTTGAAPTGLGPAESAVPEPASLVLLAMGGLAMLRRRA